MSVGGSGDELSIAPRTSARLARLASCDAGPPLPRLLLPELKLSFPSSLQHLLDLLNVEYFGSGSMRLMTFTGADGAPM